MIDALRGDELIEKMGGRFKLTALVQKRWRELLQGARPMVNPEGLTEIEVVFQEIAEGKIDIDWERSEMLTRPEGAKQPEATRSR